jgi:hypothetical protein
MEEDEKFATKQAADGDIIIAVPDAALVAPPAGQPQLTQPDLNVVAGRFATIDDVNLSITLQRGGFTNLKINTLTTTTTYGSEEKASFTGVNSPINWTYPVNTLLIGNKPATAGTSVTLELVASNDDNSKSVSRVFSINVVDPLTLATANPTTAYGDSTISIAYSIPKSTTVTPVDKVALYTKRGKNGAESLVSTNTYDGTKTALDDKFSYKMPSDNPGGSPLDTIFYRVVATYHNGRTAAKSATVRFINVPMATTTSNIVLYNPAVTGTNSGKIRYDFGTLKYATTETAADMKLVVTADVVDPTILHVGFTAGTGNTTRFVSTTASSYTSPTYQNLKKLFLAGTPVASVPDVYVGDTYIVEIDGNDPAKSNRYGIFQVASIVLTRANDNTDNITINFKSK